MLTFENDEVFREYHCDFVYKDKTYTIEYRYCELLPVRWKLCNYNSCFMSEPYCTLKGLLDRFFGEKQR